MRRTLVFVVLAVVVLVGVEGLSWRLQRRNKYGRLGLPKPSDQTKVLDPPDLWFTQQLDHYNPTDNRTWQQRYFTLTDYFKEGCPVFILIQGEGEASSSWLVSGNWVNYAKTYNALLFSVEHRFYGQSHPTDDTSVDNLRYLTAEQELADLAYFITQMNKQYQLPNDVKWIAFGGSYSGNLAAWIRFKYPHLIHGAMSASGPLLAQVDFPEYIDVVKKSLGTYGADCPSAVMAADKKMNALLKTESGRNTLKSTFQLCDDIDPNNKNDIYNLLESLSDNLAGVVQYNKDNRFTSPSNITIDTVCDVMTNKSIGAPLLRYAAVNSLLMDQYGETCVDFKYSTMIEQMKETDWESSAASSGNRQWTYQTCTEFGYYQTSEKKKSFFGKDFPLKFFLQMCQDVFGDGFTKEEINEGVYRTNILYGGLDLKATRVVYVHGTIDPWHPLGVTSTKIPESPAILIEGTAHCANMYPPADSDLPALTAAREQVNELIGQWLQQD